MAISPVSASSRGLDERRAVIASMIIAALAVIVFVASHRKPPAAAPLTETQSAIIATPASYSNFLGKLVAVDGPKWTVALVTTDEQGQSHQHIYTVTIAPTTTFQSISTTTGAAQALTVADFHIDEMIEVAGDSDLASVDHFTATKIIRLITS